MDNDVVPMLIGLDILSAYILIVGSEDGAVGIILQTGRIAIGRRIHQCHVHATNEPDKGIPIPPKTN